jgi:hypothetical protein
VHDAGTAKFLLDHGLNPKLRSHTDELPSEAFRKVLSDLKTDVDSAKASGDNARIKKAEEAWANHEPALVQILGLLSVSSICWPLTRKKS